LLLLSRRNYFVLSIVYPFPRVATLGRHGLVVLLVFVMAGHLPKVLILRHSFVKCLSRDISRGFDD